MLVKNRAVLLFFLLLLVLWIPTSCSAEWKLLESKLHENAYGTKYYYDTKMSYADGSSNQNPLVVFWGKTVFDGKGDPDYNISGFYAQLSREKRVCRVGRLSI